MPSEAISVQGMAEFRSALAAIPGEFPKRLQAAERDIARSVAGEARKFAVGYGGQQAHFASFIRGTASKRGAAIGPRGSKANAAFWGAKKRTGWYAAQKYSASTGRQFLPWVGNAWSAGVVGQGPYALNEAVAYDLPQIMARLKQATDEVARLAFPIGAS